jgi:hypothetical protein
MVLEMKDSEEEETRSHRDSQAEREFWNTYANQHWKTQRTSCNNENKLHVAFHLQI